jgi:hypothetical protein
LLEARADSADVTEAFGFEGATSTWRVALPVEWAKFGLLAAAIVTFATQLWGAILSQAATGGWFIDWRTYANTVERWLGGGSIYAPEQLNGPYFMTMEVGRGYVYPPASVPMFLPFALDSLGLLLWETFLIGAFFAGIWLVVDRGFPRQRLAAFGIVVFAAAFFYPAVQGFAAGNPNMATAGLLAMAWAGAPRVGIFAGALGVVKILPSVISILHGWKAVAIAVLTGTAIVLATLPFVGVAAWEDFVRAMRDGLPVCPNSILNPSVACTLGPVLSVRGAEMLSVVMAAGLVAVGLITGPTLLGTTAIAAAIMAPAVDLHLHYWSFAWVLLLIAVARIARRRRGEAPDPAWRPFRERWGLRTV